MPAGRGPAPGRHCRACRAEVRAFLASARGAEPGGRPDRAAPNPASISPTARQVSTSLARALTGGWGAELRASHGGGPHPGEPPLLPGPRISRGHDRDRRVPEDPPVLTGLHSASPRGLTSWLDAQAGAPIASSWQQGLSPGSSLSPTQTCSSALLPPEGTVPKLHLPAAPTQREKWT